MVDWQNAVSSNIPYYQTRKIFDNGVILVTEMLLPQHKLQTTYKIFITFGTWLIQSSQRLTEYNHNIYFAELDFALHFTTEASGMLFACQ